jgi:hypothetical protein
VSRRDSQTSPIAASQINTPTGLNRGQLTAIGTIVVAPMILASLALDAVAGE